MLRSLCETCCGLFELIRLGVITQFRFRGEYWSWRMQTAFGRGQPATRAELIRSILDYARWIHRTRRMR